MTSTKHKPLVGRIAVALLISAAVVVGGAAPANAVVTNTSGSQTCADGYKVFVRVSLIDPGTVTFYRGTRVERTSNGGSYHYYEYPRTNPLGGSVTVNWKVSAPAGIAEVSDGCVPIVEAR